MTRIYKEVSIWLIEKIGRSNRKKKKKKKIWQIDVHIVMKSMCIKKKVMKSML